MLQHVNYKAILPPKMSAFFLESKLSNIPVTQQAYGMLYERVFWSNCMDSSLCELHSLPVF